MEDYKKIEAEIAEFLRCATDEELKKKYEELKQKDPAVIENWIVFLIVEAELKERGLLEQSE